MACKNKSDLDNAFDDFIQQSLNEDFDDSDTSDAGQTDLYFYLEHESESEQDYNTEDKISSAYSGSAASECSNYIYMGKIDSNGPGKAPSNTRQTPSHNIVLKLPTLKGPAKDLGDTYTPLQAWEWIFSSDMIVAIVVHTNEKLESYKLQYAVQNCTEFRNTSTTEIIWFLLLYSNF